MRFQRVDVKLPRTKLTSMTVYPHSEGDTVYHLQSERRMVKVDVENKTLTYSKSGEQFSNFIGLMEIRGAKTIDCPEELIDDIKALSATGKVVQITG